MSKELINEYLKNSADKLKAAKVLFENDFYNDCVSRSYYSMFWAAKALLLLKGLYVKTHKGLITRFGLDFVKKGFIEKTYGKALSIAKEDRESADYEITIEYTKEEAKRNIDRAEDFYKRINEVINEFDYE